MLICAALSAACDDWSLTEARGCVACAGGSVKPVDEPEQHLEPEIPAAAEESAGPAWLHMLRLPACLWRHLALNEPRACTASVLGTSLTLTAYGARAGPPSPPSKPSVPGAGEQQPQPEPALVPSPERPFAPHPATFTFGTNTGPSNRRRKRLRAVGPATEGQASASQQDEEPWPTEQHLILQSWGCTACIRVVPPDWEDASTLCQQAEESAHQPGSSKSHVSRGFPVRNWSDDPAHRPHPPFINGIASPAGHSTPLRLSDSPRDSPHGSIGML